MIFYILEILNQNNTITLNTNIFLNNQNEYNHQFDNMIVKSVKVDGGWYCWYNFDIKC